MLSALKTVVRYPFTGGGAVFAAAALVSALPFTGLAGPFVALSFAIPIVRTSAGRDAAADSMPAFSSRSPAWPAELGAGLVLHLLYLGPALFSYLLAVALVDIPELDTVRAFTVIPLFFQVVLLVFWPSAVALLVIEGSVLPALSRVRVFQMSSDLGFGYPGLVAYALLGGLVVLILSNELHEMGGLWRLPGAGLTAWFWLVGLHLIGRVMRSQRPMSEESEASMSDTTRRDVSAL